MGHLPGEQRDRLSDAYAAQNPSVYEGARLIPLPFPFGPKAVVVENVKKASNLTARKTGSVCHTLLPNGEGRNMEIRREEQLNPVADDVLALTSIVRPILTGVLYALKADVVAEAGGHLNVKLKMLPRLYRPGDGDVGICFEYAVHEAMNSGDARVLERMETALKLCNIKRPQPKSILFGIEKTGAVQLIDTAKNILTDESRTLAGKVGQPPKLRSRLNTIAAAFRRPATRAALPYSIRGLWKADLFVGSLDTQQWVGTTVKINPAQLEGAAGLRVGIIPTRQGQNDRVRLDDGRGLVICPLHHDADFMQAFYGKRRFAPTFSRHMG